MTGQMESDKVKNYSQLNPIEEQEIEQQVGLEIVKSHYNMLKLGATANIISGIFVFWILSPRVGLPILSVWYAFIVLTSLIDVLWAYRFNITDITYEELQKWRNGFYFIVAAICLTWGSIGIMGEQGDIRYELYAITFLQIVVLAFTFTAVTDFTLSAISITCLLIPSIAFRGYLAIYSLVTTGHDTGLNLAFCINLFILAAFMLVASYFGSRLVKKLLKLTYTNVVLSQKLEKMNEFLEHRVKERTIELEKSLKLVKYQSTHDQLTELPNQRLLLEYLRSAVEASSQDNHMLAIASFSINGMEKINEVLGPQAGDIITKRIALRLRNFAAGKTYNKSKSTRYTMTISRQDVFVILVDPIHQLNEVEPKLKTLFSVLNDPITIGDQVIKLTASIGASLYPKDGFDVNTLIMHADAARLHARQSGGDNLGIYQPNIHADISRQLNIENQLHNAVKNNELSLLYQPLIALKTGKICGMEALVRWNNPALGRINPLDFISLAEANGTIIPIGEWVLRTACRQTKIWHSKGYTSLKVCVNLSAKQLQQKNIIQIISDILSETELDPKNIEFELTESQAFRDEVIPTINKLTSMGISLSIDDFGTGYSTFSGLKLFEIGTIKIDKSFIDDVMTDSDSKAIVLNTIALGKRLDIEVLAEGVETKEQVNFLQMHGCDIIQGFYFSRAVDADAFLKLLENQKSIA